MLSSFRYAIALCFPVALALAACATGESHGTADGRPTSDRTVLPDAGRDQTPTSDRGGREVGVVDTTRDGAPVDSPITLDKRVDARLDSGVTDTTVDHGPNPDSTVDSTVDLGVPTTNIGTSCVGDGNCTGGARCLLSIGGVGICTIADCTLDNLSTTANEDSCPDRAYNICGEVTLTNGTRNYCMQRCRPRSDGNDCKSGFACAPDSGDITGQLGVTVCSNLACQSGSDCPVFTGGTCDTSTRQGCGAGEICKVYSTGGYCALPGNCNTTSGLCEGHSQGQPAVKVGAPCNDDVDCGNNMVCFPEATLNGGEVVWRQGYCTITSCVFGDTVSAYACPAGSACNRTYVWWQGICQKGCSVAGATDCRGQAGDLFGDYECYAWNNLLMDDGLPVAGTPVCDTPVPCDFLAAGCPALGNAANPTNMVCRNLQNNVLTLGNDPSGFCLDTTTSGPVQ